MLLGMLACLAGVTTSYYIDVAPGATIVLLALGGFVCAWPIGALIRHRLRISAPFAPIGHPVHEVSSELHAHDHGEDCGHRAVLHGDHIDYVHDGHRHAAHNDHYDEH